MDEHSPVPYSQTPASGPACNPVLNIELMERVHQLIQMRPELHDQQTWGRTPSDTPAGIISARAETGEFCGTTACVAGWAAILGAPENALIHDSAVIIGDQVFGVSIYAARLLGLSWDQQTWLFTAAATRERVLWTLKWLPDHPDAGTDELMQAWHAEMCSWREGWL
jgi:hypothetical protein